MSVHRYDFCETEDCGEMSVKIHRGPVEAPINVYDCLAIYNDKEVLKIFLTPVQTDKLANFLLSHMQDCDIAQEALVEAMLEEHVA